MKLDFVERLGIQSFCFRGLPEHEQVVDALKECGVNSVELAFTHYKPQEEKDHSAIVSFYRDRGIEISCYGAYWFSAGEKKPQPARPAFEFAKAAGFDTICAMFDPSGFEIAEKLCEEYSMKVAIHNHGRRMRYGAVWELEEVFENTSPNIGLCLDTAWMQDSGGDPIEVARKFADRLYGVHIKDFVFDRSGRHQDVIVGEGNLDLPLFLKTLDEVGFDGFFTLEYEGDVDNPVPSTKKCVEAVRKAAASL